MKTQKTFTFVYLDRDDNEFKSEKRQFATKKEAKEHAKKLQAVSCMNGLKKIEVR